MNVIASLRAWLDAGPDDGLADRLRQLAVLIGQPEDTPILVSFAEPPRRPGPPKRTWRARWKRWRYRLRFRIGYEWWCLKEAWIRKRRDWRG